MKAILVLTNVMKGASVKRMHGIMVSAVIITPKMFPDHADYKFYFKLYV